MKAKLSKYFEKVVDLFKQGLTPHEMALSIAIGSYIGVLPLFGVSTVLITAIAVYLRLNLPLSLFFVYAVGPLHLLLFIPFIHLGEWVYGTEHSLLTFTAIKDAFSTSFLQALQDLGYQIVCGISGWLFVGLPVAIILYYVLKFGLKIVFKNKLHPKV